MSEEQTLLVVTNSEEATNDQLSGDLIIEYSPNKFVPLRMAKCLCKAPLYLTQLCDMKSYICSIRFSGNI